MLYEGFSGSSTFLLCRHRKRAASRQARELLEEQKNWERESSECYERIHKLQVANDALRKFKDEVQPIVNAYQRLKVWAQSLTTLSSFVASSAALVVFFCRLLRMTSTLR